MRRRAPSLSRRSLLVGAAAGAVLGPRAAQAAFGPPVAELAQLCHELGAARLDADGWQAQVEARLADTEARDWRTALSLDWAELARARLEQGYVSRPLTRDWATLRGWPARNPARPKLFALARGRAILPHAHRHIVSVFAVLEGRVDARHYDRVRDEDDAILIRPSSTEVLGPGDVAAISEARDNVHWFTALEHATLLNFSVTLPAPARTQSGAPGRVYLDPAGPEDAQGLIHASRTSLAALRARYERGAGT